MTQLMPKWPSRGNLSPCKERIFRTGCQDPLCPTHPKVGVDGEIRIGIARLAHLVEGRGEVRTDGAAVLVRQLDALARLAIDVGAGEEAGIEPLASRICTQSKCD